MKTGRLSARRLAVAAWTVALLASSAIGIAAWTASSDSGGGQAPSPHLHLAMLRADGILLPFAAYDGDDWKRAWPDDVSNRELPATLDDVPRSWWGGAVPGAWRLWQRDGETAAPLKPVALTMLMVGGHRRLGVRTDQKPAPLPAAPFQVPYPKIGLAVSGEVTVRPIASVSRLGPAWRELLPGLHDALTAAEERTVNGLRANAGWRHPFAKKVRSSIVPELEAWYTTSLPGSDISVSYIEAAKKYPPQLTDDGCGLETFITGWIHHNKKTPKPKTALKAVVTYCDREKASYMLPFGQMELGGRVHWVFQMSGRDHEWYTVTELTPERVRYLVEYFGGGFLR